MPVSIHEVAARAQVSAATVSRVLNNTTVQIAAATRERVEQAARELQYQPSAAARALVRRQTDTFGVVLPPTDPSPLRNPFFSALLDGVLEAATARHLNIMVFTGHVGADAGGDRNLRQMRDGRCDGLLVFYQPLDNDILPTLLDANIPCTLVSDWRDDLRLPCVDVENELAAFQLTDYLLDLGHRRIALITSDTYGRFSQLRVAGFQRALKERGLFLSEGDALVATTRWGAEHVFAAVQALMELPLPERPTALMCLTDDLAAVCMSALARLGVRVPEAVSVTGFNDDANAIRQHPALTTIRQPYVKLGECAIDLLLDRITSGADAPARKLLLPTEIVVRDSTAAPPPPLMR